MSLLLATSEAVQVGKFGAAGIFNTLLDFLIFNILTSKRFKFSKIKANFSSTTVTMIISFLIQRQLVFDGGSGDPLMQAIKFFTVTAFGLYVLQNIVITLFTKTWSWPSQLVKFVLTKTGLKKTFTNDFVLKNGAKAAATLVSLTWNYLLYKRIVFAK